jgi:hypothetical protein
MLIGAHSIIYSTNPDADRAFLRDVLKLPNVDVGGGWLIFGRRRGSGRGIRPRRTSRTSCT